MSQLTAYQREVRARVLRDCEWLVAHELLEGYSEARPYARPHFPPTRPFASDCTGTIKLVLCDWNGIPSIDGQPSGYGNTATFAQAPHAYHVPLHADRWQPMDVLLYKHHGGPFAGGPGEHATLLVWKHDGHWICFSHGTASGPKFLPWNYRSDLAAVRRYRVPRRAPGV